MEEYARWQNEGVVSNRQDSQMQTGQNNKLRGGE